LDLPVPHIYASSSDPLNPVGAEYVIEEKTAGKPLGSLWYSWDMDSRHELVAQLINFNIKLPSVSFSSHGCIYFEKDLATKTDRVDDLEVRSRSSGDLIEGLPAEEIALEPLTEANM
jgi:hypothetical protein